MKIVLCHNYYQQPGGEDQVFADEAKLLQSRGHEVVCYTLHNDSIRQMSPWAAARRTFWNADAYGELRRLFRRERPGLVHCTNLFPLISPAAYYAARKEGVPVVQSLHNYRWLCPNALLLRDGQPCDRCVGGSLAWRAVAHGCYRGSRLASAVVAATHGAHAARRTWDALVARYIAPSLFAQRQFVQAGLSAEKVSVKPNFLSDDPEPGRGEGGYAAYVGRLAPEKGIDVLLDAWRLLDEDLPLRIVGDGILADRVRRAADADPRIRWLGYRPADEVLRIVGDAACVVSPSVCYETFGRVVIEAYAKGTPVIVPDRGSMAELIEPGRTGLCFAAGSPADLAAKVRGLLADRSRLAAMRRSARRQYEQHYTAHRNYDLLMEVYRQAMERRPRGARRRVNTSGTTARREAAAVAHPIAWPPKKDLFGVGISTTTYHEATRLILQAARRRTPALVSLQPVHALVVSSRDSALRQVTNDFTIVAPDGQPVRWALNLLHRAALRDRVNGPQLMLHLCRGAAETGVSIYLYGSTPRVLAALAANLRGKFPRLEIAGAESPPFRPLTPEEDEALVRRIDASGAGLVFVGLGHPKQDMFAHAHRDRIRVPQICVGAAFDFHAGLIPRAPEWMQRSGLEWLYRLVQEPRRLWRRYLTANSLYFVKLGGALLGLLWRVVQPHLETTSSLSGRFES